jgi:F0F1-type ATP synthase delta subunit
VAPETDAPDKAPSTEKQLVGLPLLVVGPVDVGRLIRELEAIDEQLLQAHLRNTESRLPRLTQLMEQTVELNKLNLLHDADRKHLQELLTTVRDQAPVLHVSFSADPSSAFIEKLMTWLRREIHPVVLLTIGLQPSLGAGCIVRSINKQFDLSLRQDFIKQRDLLMSKIVGEVKEPAK